MLATIHDKPAGRTAWLFMDHAYFSAARLQRGSRLRPGRTGINEKHVDSLTAILQHNSLQVRRPFYKTRPAQETAADGGPSLAFLLMLCDELHAGTGRPTAVTPARSYHPMAAESISAQAIQPVLLDQEERRRSTPSSAVR
jgi:hypothetical protein